MSEPMSSSVDTFLEDGDEAINDAALEPEIEGKVADPFIDSRRRLEARLAERRLEKDLREFDFDI